MGRQKKKSDYVLPSQNITDFLNWISDVESNYAACQVEVEEEEKDLQDYLHELELAKTCQERNKVATRFANSRKRRRESKNQMILTQEIVDFFNIKENRDCMNRLKKLLGKQRNKEAYVFGEKHYIKRSERINHNAPCTAPIDVSHINLNE